MDSIDRKIIEELQDVSSLLKYGGEKGKFVLFSSFLEHGCKASKSKNIKYGISFNMKTLSVTEDVWII